MLNVDTTQSVNGVGNARAMDLFIFNGDKGMSDEEVALAMPDEEEAQNLTRHVARCGMRFKLFTKRLSSQGEDISKIKYMLIVLIVLLFLTSPQLHDFLRWLFPHV